MIVISVKIDSVEVPMRKVYISGLGQVPVTENWDKSLKELAGDAALLAMQDADIGYPDAL